MAANLSYWLRRIGIPSSGKVATVVALLGLGSAALYFYRDARDVAADFRPEEGSRCVNVNTADADMLTTLPGVGHAMAQRIIAGRPYSKPDDLLRVSGIAPRSLEGFKAFVIVSGETRKRTGGESC